MVEGTSANNNNTNNNNSNNSNNSNNNNINNNNNNNNNNSNNSNSNNNTNNNRPRSKMARPKPVCLWQVHDVLKWYRRHCSEYLEYLELFSKHEITGRTLLRITDTSLKRMGITDNCDRDNIWREIVKQRLKTDIMEIRDMERIVNQHNIVKINHHHHPH